MKIGRRRSRLAKPLQDALIVHFVAGVPARTAAERVGVNRNSAILFCHKLREVIADRLAELTPSLDGHVAVDESCFGGRRKGKRGRSAAGKMPVFGLLKRRGLVHAEMIPDARASTPVSIIRKHLQPDSIAFTESYDSYNVLDVSEFHQVRINHRERFVAPKGNHINGIPRQHFHRYIKECDPNACFPSVR